MAKVTLTIIVTTGLTYALSTMLFHQITDVKVG